MKRIFKLFAFSFAIAFVMALNSCQNNTQVVPFDIDIDELFKPLQSNEEEMPNDTTYGAEKIPGITIEKDFKTSQEDVYVFYENFTLLDLNAAIIQNLFEFSQLELSNYGFIDDNAQLPENEILNLITQGRSYKEAALEVLSIQQSQFDEHLNSTEEYGPHFNISFRIYPLYLDEKYVTFYLNAYAYTGGAHGTTVTYVRTYDLVSGKLLELDDIVKSDSIKDIREEVVAHMAYSYPIYENITTVNQYLDSLNVFMDGFHGEGEPGEDEAITINNYPLPDPALTSEGLLFVYQMYVLTPASDGCPVVLIPYKDIKGCLKDHIGK